MRDTKFRRGQIWWMEGYEVHKEGAKQRPALIISNEVINSNMANNAITVVPITSNIERANMRTNVIFDRHNHTKNIIKCGEPLTIYKNQLTNYESTLDDEAMRKVEEAIKFALGLTQQINEMNEENKPKICEEETETGKIILEVKEETKTEDDYAKIMAIPIAKHGKNVIWNTEVEALFMKIYSNYGAEAIVEKFGMTRGSALSCAYRLRKKYPEFKCKRER